MKRFNGLFKDKMLRFKNACPVITCAVRFILIKAGRWAWLKDIINILLWCLSYSFGASRKKKKKQALFFFFDYLHWQTFSSWKIVSVVTSPFDLLTSIFVVCDVNLLLVSVSLNPAAFHVETSISMFCIHHLVVSLQKALEVLL